MKTTFQGPKGTEPILAGIKWHEKYNCYEAKLAGCIPLAFSYENGAYTIVVLGRTLKERAETPEFAARLACEMAGKLLRIGLKELEANG